MLSHLLFLAADAEASGGITAITRNFGITVPQLLAQVVSFSLIAFILWRFAFRPVLATLDERQRKIASGLQYAEEMKAKLEAAKQETEALLRKTQAEANRIIEEAQKTGKGHVDRQIQEAAARAAEVMAKAQQGIELEHRKMIAEARAEIARLVVATTQRVLAKELSESDRTRYNEAAVRELSEA